MINFLPLLSTALSIIASGLVIIVLSINLYCKIRRKFQISVNCWFCNTWTRVHYDNRDSFDCPNCLQYNGFTKDGDYNKIIPEQHDELMNKSSQIKTNNKTAAINGLCTLCNNNQQLKVFQLANFVPLVEENYDVEIEHFQEQLEKAYKLCKKCDKVLRKTIEKQNAWIFGNKIKNLCKNGVASVKTLSEQIKKGVKLPLLTKLTGIASVLLVFLIIFITLSSVKHFTKTVSRYVPAGYLPAFKAMLSSISTSKIIETNVFERRNIRIEPFIFTCCIGLLVQVIGAIWEKYSSTVKVNRLLCWLILLLTSWVRSSSSYALYILFAEVFCCVYLLWTSFNKPQEKVHPQKPSGKAMRKLVKNLEYTCTDFSDTSDFEDVSSSSKKTNSSQESIYSTQTNLQNSFNTARSVLNYTDLNKSHNFTDFSKNHAYSDSIKSQNFTDFGKSRSYLNNTNVDLNRSLNNLHLGFKPPAQTFSVASVQLKRPKPVLSPPRFQTDSSWLAGGFWRNDGVMMPTQRSNLSRSSSESSGFGSQHNENLQFVPPRSHYVGEFDKMSELSHVRTSPNPEYLFSPINKPEFYPNLHQNFMGDRTFGQSPSFQVNQPIKYNEPHQRRSLFQNWSDKINAQTTQNFRDLSLHSNGN